MEPPLKPDESDCCNSGCNPCILDIYEDQLKKYLNNLKKYEEENCRNFKNCICPSSYSSFQFVSKERHTTNAYLFKFKYCSKTNCHDKKLFYEPGQHFLLKGRECSSDKEFTRAYTPIPYGENDNLSFTILVKLYEKGKMSSYLRCLKLGQETVWRGPYCKFSIDFNLKNMLFIAQGTGIAPIFAVIKEMLPIDSCETFLHLLYCCTDINEIFLRNELYCLKDYWNFNYEVFLKNSNNIIPKYKEVIHERKLQKGDIELFIENKKKDIQIVICGSKAFENNILDCTLSCGIENYQVFVF